MPPRRVGRSKEGLEERLEGRGGGGGRQQGPGERGAHAKQRPRDLAEPELKKRRKEWRDGPVGKRRGTGHLSEEAHAPVPPVAETPTTWCTSSAVGRAEKSLYLGYGLLLKPGRFLEERATKPMTTRYLGKLPEWRGDTAPVFQAFHHLMHGGSRQIADRILEQKRLAAKLRGDPPGGKTEEEEAPSGKRAARLRGAAAATHAAPTEIVPCTSAEARNWGEQC